MFLGLLQLKMRTNKRGTVDMYKKYSKLFPMSILKRALVHHRSCISKLDHTSNTLQTPGDSSGNQDFTISIMKAQDQRSIDSTDNELSSEETSVIDPSIIIKGKLSMKQLSGLDQKKVIPHCSELGQTDSWEKVSNYSYSSTSSKVSVNSKFMEVVRFSLKENIRRFPIIYNKYNLQKDKDKIVIPKRKSKS